MYSPGALNFAVVDVFPSLESTVGLSLSKVTAPVPLNILQVRFAGGPWRGRASGGCFPSSLTQASRGRGSPTLTLSDVAIPRGGPVNGAPPDWNRNTGGVFPTPASSNGSTI